ncbi:MAG TPA: serine/threonine-protein kinase [Verrucomicrobiae bacterium]|jgi:serine/threonine protein kinase
MSDASNSPDPQPAREPAAQRTISIPEHEVIRQIGHGASGEVWLARNFLGVYRAVKIMRFQEAGQQRSFENEFAGIMRFEPISRLHDGLVDILQVGQNKEQGYFYYVMELADCVHAGQAIDPTTYLPHTLAQHVRERGRLPARECIRLGAAMASALGFLHRQNLVHRDLKPSNIIFVNGFPKLADIGLVTGMSGEQAYVGTEGFIAPEGSGTAQADIFSLGKILYEMITGQSVREFPVLPADLGTDEDSLELAQFSRIVLKACRTNPPSRYDSADDLMTALLSFQFTNRVYRWGSKNHPLGRSIGLIGAISGAVFAIYVVWRVVSLLRHSP